MVDSERRLAQVGFTPEMLVTLTRGTYRVTDNPIPEDAGLRNVYTIDGQTIWLVLEHESFPITRAGNDLLVKLDAPTIERLDDEPLVIDGYAMPCEPHSTADDPAIRSEENLHFGARDTLEAIRKRYGTKWMMRALPQVAHHYAVDKNALLGVWVRHYAPSLLLEMQEKKT
jgi:hypothetical protein